MKRIFYGLVLVIVSPVAIPLLLLYLLGERLDNAITESRWRAQLIKKIKDSDK